MDVIDRIEQAPACGVINLSEAEKDIYQGGSGGCGWKLARFDQGQLVELFNPLDRAQEGSNLRGAIDSMIKIVMDWLNLNKKEDIWLVMCSCYQLCEPRKSGILDAAHVLRVFSDEIASGW